MVYICGSCGSRRGLKLNVCVNCGGLSLIYYPSTYGLWSLKSLLRNWRKKYKSELLRVSYLQELVIEDNFEKIS